MEYAPPFTLPSLHNGTRSLSDLRQDGHHVVLVFLRHLG